jgi:dTDP-4-dehydrorhamnose reductase
VRLLITGGRGQLGRALQAALSGHELLAPGHASLDVTDAERVREAFDGFQPELVIHAGAWTDTGGCEADPERALLVNSEGTRIIAAACAAVGAAMLYVSTNEVFDGESSEPYREEDAPNPINVYGRSKLEGERHVQALLERHHIVRTSWLYGPGRVSFPEKIVQAARGQGRLRLVTDEVASPTWTVDLAAAIARLVQQQCWGVYHVTNEGYCSRLEWALEVLRLAGLDGVPVEPTTQSEFGAAYRKPVFSALSLEKARGLGVETPPWRDVLARHMRRVG